MTSREACKSVPPLGDSVRVNRTILPKDGQLMIVLCSETATVMVGGLHNLWKKLCSILNLV